MARQIFADEAFQNFGQGINCCMQVFSAAAEELDLSVEEARRLGAGFGGGMGLGSTCGCVTGALMALGYKYGNEEPGQSDRVALFNEKKKAFLTAFTEKFGSTRCPDLLGGLNPAVPEDKAQIGEKGLMKSVCANAVVAAAEILKELL